MHPNFKRVEDKRKELIARNMKKKTLIFKFSDSQEREVDNNEISMHTDMDFYAELELAFEKETIKLKYKLIAGKITFLTRFLT